MLEITRRKWGFKFKDFRFSDKLHTAACSQAIFTLSEPLKEHKHSSKGFTYLLKLNKPEDELFNGINKAARYDVRKAKEENITTQISNNHKDVNKFYKYYKQRLLEHNAKSKLISLNDIKYNLKNGFLIIAEKNGNFISGYIFLSDGENALYWLSGTDYSFGTKITGYANKLLMWRAFLNLKKQGVTILDLGGAAPKAEGYKKTITKFKASFGGTLKEEYKYKITNSKILKWLGI